jgi:hypothetical protein
MKLLTKNQLSNRIFELMYQNKQLLELSKETQDTNEKNIQIIKQFKEEINFLRKKLNTFNF